MDELVKQAEAAGEAVKVAKGGDSKEAIKAAVDALVAIKEKITALDPSHPLALVDKAAKKKAEKEKKKKEAEAAAAANGGGDAGPSKNAQKAAAKKALKDAKKKAHKEGAAPPPAAAPAAAAPKAAAPKAAAPKAAAPKAAPAPGGAAAGVVYFGADAPPLAAMATVAAVAGGATFAVDAALKKAQPYTTVGGCRVFGAATIARHVARAANAAAFLGGASPADAALVDQWVELSLSYPAFGDGPGLVAALAARLAAVSYTHLTLPTKRIV